MSVKWDRSHIGSMDVKKNKRVLYAFPNN